MVPKSQDKPTDNSCIKDVLISALFKDSASLSDVDLLKLFLLINNSRQNNSDEAINKLMTKFQNLGSLLNAEKEKIIQVSGMSDNMATALKVIKACARRSATEALHNQKSSVLKNWNEFLQYCRQIMAYSDVEEFHVFFLDEKLQCFENKMLSKGTINQTVAHPREVIKQALSLKAKNLILAHNHPSGDCTPSFDDIDLTRDICQVAESVGIHVIDHIIVTEGPVCSFKKEGLLDEKKLKK